MVCGKKDVILYVQKQSLVPLWNVNFFDKQKFGLLCYSKIEKGLRAPKLKWLNFSGCTLYGPPGLPSEPAPL